MIPEFLTAIAVVMVLFFIILWALIVAIGFILSLRDGRSLPDECRPTTMSSPGRG